MSLSRAVLSREPDLVYQRVGAEPMKTTTFRVQSELYINGKFSPLAWLPSREKCFDVFFFKQLYDHLAEKTHSHAIPLPALRNMSFKVMDAFQIRDGFEDNFFGVDKEMCSWPDMLDGLKTVGHPRIELTRVEIFYEVLDDQESSNLGKVWFYFIMIVTIANLSGIIWPSLPGDLCTSVHSGADPDSCVSYFKWFCMLVFSFDYTAKLVCSAFVRSEIMHPENVSYLHSDEWVYKPLSRAQKLYDFFMQYPNLVDFVAILPFWLAICVGPMLPSTSFLRMIRMARLFRVLKTVRNLDMVQVLGVTLVKSTSLIFVLYFLIAIVSLISGCLFHAFEKNNESTPAFATVPHASYWVFSRVLGMKDVVGRSGIVETNAGIVLLSIAMTLKGVLWIVPIQSIQKIFKGEYAAVMHAATNRQSVEKELHAADTATSHKIVTTQGTVCCSIRLTGAELPELLLPVPILLSTAAKIDSFDLPVSMPDGSAGEICFQMEWQPSSEMQETKDTPLPSGQLKLEVTATRGLPSSISGMVLGVPTATFGRSDHTLAWRQGSFGGPAEFAVRWASNGIAATPHKEENLEDKHDMQRSILDMLEQRKALLQAQSKRLAEQALGIQKLEAARAARQKR